MSSDTSMRTQLVIYYYMGLVSRHSLDNQTVSTRGDKHKAWWDYNWLKCYRLQAVPSLYRLYCIELLAPGSILSHLCRVLAGPGQWWSVYLVLTPGTGDCLASGSAQFLPGCSSGQCRCQHTATHHTSGQLIVNTASCHWQVVARTCSRMCECESFAS